MRAQVGTKLRGFGASLLSGTTGLLENLHDTISAELEGMEDQLVGRGRAAHASAARCGNSPAQNPVRAWGTSCWGAARRARQLRAVRLLHARRCA